MHDNDFVCLSDDDVYKHIDSLLKNKYRAKDMGTLGFEDSDVKSLLLLSRVFRVGVDQTAQHLNIEPDLRHTPLIISEAGCNTNTKAVSTSRKKLQDKLMLDGRLSPTKCSVQRMSEPREYYFVPLKHAARYLVGKSKAALRFRRQKHVDKITVFVDSDFANDLVSR